MKDLLKHIRLSIFLVLITGFFSCSTNKSLLTPENKTFELGYYSAASALGGHGYDFLDDSTTIYKWSSDLFRFEREGKYVKEGDTLIIMFTPIIQIHKTGENGETTRLNIQNTGNQMLFNFPIKIFYDNTSSVMKSDSNGMVSIEREIETIDSIYFNWKFEAFGRYPIDNKFVPRQTQVDGQLLKGHVSLKVIIDEELIGHPINRDRARLLVIGKNQLFNGVNYDPNGIYLGGIFKKK